MAAVAHSPKFAKKVGIPTSVGKDFMEADKGKKFKEGGMMKHDDIVEDKKLIKRAFKMHDNQEHKGEHTDLSKLKKGGMAMKKYAKGGMAKETMGPRTMSMEVEKGKHLAHGEHGEQKRGHTRGKEERGYKTLGIQSGAKGGSKKTVGAAPIKMAKGGSASARADGMAMKGKTRGKMC